MCVILCGQWHVHATVVACSWLPQHLILREASKDGTEGRILGAVPLYMVRCNWVKVVMVVSWSVE